MVPDPRISSPVRKTYGMVDKVSRIAAKHWLKQKFELIPEVRSTVTP